MLISINNLLIALAIMYMSILSCGCQEKKIERITAEIAPSLVRAESHVVSINGVNQNSTFTAVNKTVHGKSYNGIWAVWNNGHVKILASDRDENNNMIILVDSTSSLELTVKLPSDKSGGLFEMTKSISPGKYKLLANSSDVSTY